VDVKKKTANAAELRRQPPDLDCRPDDLDKCLQECLLLNPPAAWLRVSEEQFVDLRYWEPEHNTMETARREYDLYTDFRDKMTERQCSFSDIAKVLIREHIAKDLFYGIQERCSLRHIFASAPARMYVSREAYKVTMFAWLHFRVISVNSRTQFAAATLNLGVDL